MEGCSTAHYRSGTSATCLALVGGPGPARQAIIVHTGPLEMAGAVRCVSVDLNQDGALAWASLCIMLVIHLQNTTTQLVSPSSHEHLSSPALFPYKCPHLSQPWAPRTQLSLGI